MVLRTRRGVSGSGENKVFSGNPLSRCHPYPYYPRFVYTRTTPVPDVTRLTNRHPNVTQCVRDESSSRVTRVPFFPVLCVGDSPRVPEGVVVAMGVPDRTFRRAGDPYPLPVLRHDDRTLGQWSSSVIVIVLVWCLTQVSRHGGCVVWDRDPYCHSSSSLHKECSPLSLSSVPRRESRESATYK